MFDIEKFASEMLVSQKNGEITPYCQKYWEEALRIMPNANLDMDLLIEKALIVKVSNQLKVTTDVTLKYWKFVESLKTSKVSSES